MTKYIKPRDLEMFVRAAVELGFRITHIKRNGKRAQGGEIAITLE